MVSVEYRVCFFFITLYKGCSKLPTSDDDDMIFEHLRLVFFVFNQCQTNTNEVQTCQVNLWRPLFAADGIVSPVSLQCIIAMYNSNNSRHNRDRSYWRKFGK